MVSPGQIIVLDGPSSAGKSTLARALQTLLPEPYWHVSQDHFWQMLPPEGTAQRNRLTADGCLTAFHHAIAALVQNGSNVIVDTGLMEDAWLREMQTVLAPFRILYVAVRCPLAELERRERERGDRPPGYTRQQFARLLRHSEIYSVTVDTSLLSPFECAVMIQSALEEGNIRQHAGTEA